MVAMDRIQERYTFGIP